jgi:hypothetical protein
MRGVKRSVETGPSELDQRLEAQLGRPLDPLEWRTDLTWPARSAFWAGPAGGLPGEPYLVIAWPPRQEAYEPLKTRRLPEDFRVLARAVYPEPSGTWLESDRLAPWKEGDPDQRIGVQATILAFANRYGFLGNAAVVLDQSGKAISWGESLSFWTRELGIFRCLMELVDGVERASKGGELERRNLNAQVDKRPSGRQLRLGHTTLFLDRSELVGRSPHIAIADRLRNFVQERVSVSLAPLAVGRPLRFRPTTLLSAIYLDLAMEIVDGLGARLRECEYCHRPYRAARRDSHFCSTACRSNAHYHKSKGER